jgi:septation ring formation regulator EzrA
MTIGPSRNVDDRVIEQAEKELEHADLLKTLRRPLLSIVRALSVQRGPGTPEECSSLHANAAETAQSSFRMTTPRPISQVMVDQQELQAATHATLRAHAITDEAKALVAKLATMVEDHGISAGLRKNRRKGTAGNLEYASGAFLANLLRALSAEVPEPNGWVYRSMQASGWNLTLGARV